MEIGKKAPQFSLKDKDGIAHSLSEMTTPNICLFFYPKDNTPGCTLEAKEFTAHLSKFKKHGCVVVGISGGDEKSKRKFCENNALDVILLSDPDFKISKAYKTFGEKKFMGRTYNGIFRKTFVIGADRTVIKVFEDVKPEGHAAEVLEFLATATQKPSSKKTPTKAAAKKPGRSAPKKSPKKRP
jgi:peroxiredoxin Q/BCP